MSSLTNKSLKISIQINQLNIKKGVYGIRTNTWDAKAHDLCKWGVNCGLKAQETKNHAIRHQIF